MQARFHTILRKSTHFSVKLLFRFGRSCGDAVQAESTGPKLRRALYVPEEYTRDAAEDVPMNPSDTGLTAEFTLEDNKSGVIEEPSFRMLFLGDWSGDATGDKGNIRRPFEIDRDNFDETIGRLGVGLDVDVGGQILEMEFKALDDFHPDQIYRRVPLFDEFRDLRRRLNAEGTYYEAAREVRAMLGPTEAKTGSDAAVQVDAGHVPADNPVDLLDAILSHPEGGEPPPTPRVSSELSHLIKELVRPHLTFVDEAEQSDMLAAVDAATAGLMRGILHNRKFQALEAAWRGLFFVARHVETSADLKMFILDVSKEEFIEELKSAENLSGTELYRILVTEAVENPGGEPWAAVFGNYAFSPDVDDVAALMRVSKICAAAGAPFVSQMRPDLLGINSMADDPESKTWKISNETDAGKLWTLLRGQAESGFLGMVTPRFLARLPYGSRTEPLEAFSFEEFTDEPVHYEYVWSNSCFAVARLLAESYSSYGWEMGRALKRDIEGLPLHVYDKGAETVFTPCSEVCLTDHACERLLDYGLMPLVTYKNSDHVQLVRFQSVADPVTALKGRWN
jgi:type VI secretion system protein ImpC